MPSRKKNQSTNVNTLRPSCITPQKAKEALYKQGITLKKFAEQHGFQYRTVSDVVRGINKANYGEGHAVAIALGIK